MAAIAGIYIFLWFDFLHHRGEKQVMCVLSSTHPKFEKEMFLSERLPKTILIN